MNIHSVIRAVALCSTVLCFSNTASAQQFPSKPIKLLVGFSAGGGTDAVARVYAQKLQEILKTPVVVDNRPGAFEAIAAQALTSAPPDGYTIWLATTMALVTGPAIREVSYDPARSLTLLGKVAEADGVFVVRKDLPVNNLSDLIKYAKEHPGKLNYASAGVGAPNHLIPEYLLSLTGAKATHVPYKSDSDVAREVAAGTVDFALGVAAILSPFVTDERLKGIAVTSQQRLKSIPNVPSVMEDSLPEAKSLGVYAFYAFAAPAGLPSATAQVLTDAIAAVNKVPEVKQKLESMNFRPASGSPAEVRQIIESEVPKWREVGRKAGI